MTHIKKIAFQGAPGAYSDLACRDAFPDVPTLPCPSFADVFEAVRESQASIAMVPIENSVAGRVADTHHLLPESGLYIIGEHFERIHHHLLAPADADLEHIRVARSHIQALSQCRTFLEKHDIALDVRADTAQAAADLAANPEPHVAVIASSLAAETYGLSVLASGIENASHNTTRFLMLGPSEHRPAATTKHAITSLVFRTRNIPASLYKGLGGFATNGVNLTKLESYMLNGSFSATQFYTDIEGHPDQAPTRLALDELAFFAREIRILGVYEAHPFRHGARTKR